MLKGRFKYVALIIFLSGLILIVFLQFNSGRSIDKLIEGNTSLLNELKIQNDLQKLQTEIVTVESQIRGAVITQNRQHLEGIREEIDSINHKLKFIEGNIKDQETSVMLKKLNELVNRKIIYSQQVIDTFLISGKPAAEKIINTNNSQRLSDSLFDVVDDVDSSRQVSLSEIVESVDASGAAARNRGLVLAIVACIFCIVAFWYIVNQSMQQQRLINILDASEKKVKEAAHIKEQFLANMSHEIRTPMNAMLGFTNLLHKTKLNGEQQQYVENIQASGEKLLAIVNDILDLSKIEAGMMRIEPAPFSLRALLHSVQTMFSERVKQKGLSLSLSVNEGIHDTLEGDSVRLTQVLVNLLSNAVKFTSSGGIHVDVSKADVINDQLKLRFSVKDTGIGIAPGKLETIFERFQQAEADTTRRYGGTGLGLSIAKQIIDLQNGTITVSSEPGKGTEFIFELTYLISKQKAESPAKTVAGLTYESVKGKIRLLVAEDNIMNQQLMKHLMNNWRFEFDIVNNGREALERLQSNEYDAVLMDIQMPEMDGYTATKILRNELNLKVPVIAMTAHAMAGEKEKCISFGMNDYISKPINETELYNILLHYTNTIHNHAGKSSSVIDLDYLNELSKGDKNFETEMIRQFIIQVPEEIKSLELFIQQKDFTAVKSAAHGLKSSVSFVGLSAKLQPVLEHIEKHASSGNGLKEIQQNFEQLQTICEQAIEEAKSLLV
jgi:signal transduction histidine kinase/DNA-binding response OmpR family regulator